MSISSVWLRKIKTGNVHDCVTLGIFAHFAWLPDIFGSLSLSNVCFDIPATEVRPTVNFYNPVMSLRKAMFNTVIPRLTKIIRSGITFVRRNLR